MNHYCYILNNINNLTYNGYTNNLTRRLRQHNNEIVGGAKYTKGKGPWDYLLIIESDELTKKLALSLEWSIKYPTNKKPRPKIYSTPEGRILSLPLVFSNPKFINYKFKIRVNIEYYNLVYTTLSHFDNIIIELKNIIF